MLRKTFPAFKILKMNSIFKSGMCYEYAKYLTSLNQPIPLNEAFTTKSNSIIRRFIKLWGIREEQFYNFFNSFKSTFLKLYEAGKFKDLDFKIVFPNK